MPPHRNGQDTTTVEDILSGGPGPDVLDTPPSFMETVQADNDTEPEGYVPDNGEEELPYEEEVQAPEGSRSEKAHADAGQEEQHEEEVVEDDDEEISMRRGDYKRMLEMLGLDDTDVQAAQETPVANPEAAAAEAPVPVAPTPLTMNLPKTYDELIELQSNPEQYAQHIGNIVNNAVAQALASVEPIINQRAAYVYQASEFNRKFFEEYPEVPVPVAIKGLQVAQRKLGPDASWDDLYSETAQNCAFAMAVAKTAKKADQRTNGRAGRFSPQTARRTRPGTPAPKRTVTEEVMANITQPKGYDDQTAQLLHDIGL